MLRGDHVGGGIQLERVVVEVGDEALQVAPAQAAPVAPQVDRVEVEAEVLHVVGQVGLEEVVVPAVQVQHRRP